MKKQNLILCPITQKPSDTFFQSSLSFPDYQVKALVGVKDRIVNDLETRLLDKLIFIQFFSYRKKKAVVVSCFQARSFAQL